MTLGEKLKGLRKKNGLSQLQLSEKLMVSRQAVSGWEAGSSRPSTENLQGLSKLYSVPLEYLLDDDALETVCADQDASREKEEKNINKRKKYIALTLIAIGLLIVILCAMIVSNKEESPVPMGDMKGSEMETGGDFEFEWQSQ